MNTKTAFDRLAKCGVVVDRLYPPECPPSDVYTHMRLRDALSGSLVQLSDDHAAMLLEAAWHRKWPHLTVTQGISGGWFVWDSHNDSIVTEEYQPTRLTAMVLAAESAAKESP